MTPNQPSLTKGRQRLAHVLRGSPGLVTVDAAAESLGLDRAEAARILSRWHNQGLIRRLKHGLYAPVDSRAMELESVLPHPWLMVPYLFRDAYVGGWSAAEHWDLTEQIFKDVCVFSTTPERRKEIVVEKQKYVVTVCGRNWSFGTKKFWVGSTSIPISDVHKTVLDMAAFPKSGGGSYHVLDCIRAYRNSDEFRPDILTMYTDRVDTGAVYKRLGYFADLAGFPAEFVEHCRLNISEGISELMPGQTPGRIVSRWNLRLPKSWSEP